MKGPSDGSICFCRTLCDGDTTVCSNEECPYGRFHTECQSLGGVTIPKKWYCPHCSRLPQFKIYSRKKSGVKIKAQANSLASTHASLLFDTICICKVKATKADRLMECHFPNCTNGKFFSLAMLMVKENANDAQDHLEMLYMPHNKGDQYSSTYLPKFFTLATAIGYV